MNPRSILFLLLAVGAAALAAVFTRGWMHAQQQALSKPAGPPPVIATEVLVAGHAMPAGTFVKPEDLRWQKWPEGTLVTGYIVKSKDQTDGGKNPVEGFAGAVVKSGINAGEPITESRVAKPGDRGFLAAVLTPGTRAVALSVNPTTGVSGFVLPGDRVDVLVTHALPGSGESKRPITVTETALEDLRVIAVDQTTDDQADKPVLAKTVTLEATPKQAETLDLIAQMGKVSLALRSLGTEPTAVSRVAAKKPHSRPTFTVDREVSALLAASEAPKAEPKIQVVRGTKTQFESVASAGGKVAAPNRSQPAGESVTSRVGIAPSAVSAAITGQLP